MVVRIDVKIEQEQKTFLESIPGNLTYHIKRALDEYIDRIKANRVSTSPSKKGGEYGSGRITTGSTGTDITTTK